ncbi:helix-turn-helix domain-containing protein [Echinicola vietnamensis]|uniref:DNA-binding domain-containing protein, AraC-type n=1 Tax=Echinicola vietnamensis (strain DSM 17526 / LMG 23754 / KMM 6221) TaxID=926556 RepID=L0FVW7_ECHVK|nr:helix-turn-helix transcriptional regulator [Echinicola vietnamensis]AGA78014.1 DNA-binding domain-containing protein, AraC-type [Echinicola vietnamensis DSM 17526]
MAELLVRNMVCPRCIMAVESTLKEQNIFFDKVALGKVTLPSLPEASQIKALEAQLEKLGFGLIQTPENRLIERIKNLLHELLLLEEIPASLSLAKHLGNEIGEDYSKMSHLFSIREGITIEKYFIKLKLEKVKELLFNQELQLSEIAWKLGYSSVQHLSGQFKKNTGMTPSSYKKLKEKPRVGLDKLT